MDTAKYDRLLGQAGWTIARAGPGCALALPIARRYSWLPVEMVELVGNLSHAVNEDEQAWILAASDFAGHSSAAYAWNEWELQSLKAAGADRGWGSRIRTFWDGHFPFLMSVKSGYAYFAMERDSRAIVVGEEPEFEEVAVIGAGLEDVLQKIADGDPALARWV